MARENIYKESFRNLIEKVSDFTYVGEGNPNSKILIIGKECAINDLELEKKIATQEIDSKYSLRGVEGEEKYILKEKAIAELNLNRWKTLIETTVPEQDILKLIESKVEEKHKEYYPLFPHLGQRYQQRRNKGGKTIGEKGTAPTWYFYQSLVDNIMGYPKKNKESLIDFHLNSFHTEMSQIPLPMSNELKNAEHLRRNSIQKRSELFRDPFFRQFPVIILGVGPYPKNYSFDIENVFDVKFKCTQKLDNSWVNIHYEKSGSPRILIHTRQFSRISLDFITELAYPCSNFI